MLHWPITRNHLRVFPDQQHPWGLGHSLSKLSFIHLPLHAVSTECTRVDPECIMLEYRQRRLTLPATTLLWSRSNDRSKQMQLDETDPDLTTTPQKHCNCVQFVLRGYKPDDLQSASSLHYNWTRTRFEWCKDGSRGCGRTFCHSVLACFLRGIPRVLHLAIHLSR